MGDPSLRLKSGSARDDPAGGSQKIKLSHDRSPIPRLLELEKRPVALWIHGKLVHEPMGKSKRVASRSKKQPEAKTGKASQYWSYAWLSLVIFFFAAIRFRLRSMPLERDEGEYAYIGQLMLQGIPPYKLAYTMKLPGTQTAYALLMAIFGQTPQGIRTGVLLLNAATTVLVYLLGKRLTDRLSGVVAAACYALLSTSFTVLGLSAHATHFVV